MSLTLTGNNPYSNYMAPAFVGMKEDSMDDNVDTFAAAGVVNIGIAVKRTGANSMIVQNGAAAGLTVGVSLHDHIVGYTNGYQDKTAVSVLTRGRVWVKVSDGTGVMDNVPCKADGTTGEFSASGTLAVVNAVFRSNAVALLNVDGVTTTLAAAVELHYPNV